MGQHATDTTSIKATAAEVRAVIADLDEYPQWAEGVTKTTVHSSDDEGRPLEVTMWIDAKVFQIDYKIKYRYPSENLIEWSLLEGDQITQLDGSYLLEEQDGVTKVTYSLEVDIALPLPGFMKKRGAKVIMATGLKGLRDRVEQG